MHTKYMFLSFFKKKLRSFSCNLFKHADMLSDIHFDLQTVLILSLKTTHKSYKWLHILWEKKYNAIPANIT